MGIGLMPRRNSSDFKDHNGKFKYVSTNYQRDWNIKDNKLEIVSNVELDQGEKLTIPTDLKLTKSDVKERRELIKKHHPDKGGSDEELKQVLKKFES
jgi:hypothetical protein